MSLTLQPRSNPYTHPLAHREPTKPPGGDLGWAYAAAPWTRPLKPAEQTAFTDSLTLMFNDRSYNTMGSRTTPTLIGLILTNTPYATAFAQAASTLPPAPHDLQRNGKPRKYLSPIADAEAWLAVWSWLPEPIRTALRRHIPSLWTDEAQYTLSLLDPQAPRPSASALASLQLDQNNLSLFKTTSPFTLPQWLAYVRSQFSTANTRVPRLIARTLIRRLPTEALDELFADRMMNKALPAVLYCPDASPALVRRALQAHPLPFTEYERGPLPIRSLPWLATIDASATLQHRASRADLLRLAPWVRFQPWDIPRLHFDHHASIRAVLQTEWNGSYADEAEAVWLRVLHEPLPARPHCPTTRPLSQNTVWQLVTQPTTEASELAVCLNADLNFLMEERLASHPNITPELASRLSRHPSMSFRKAIVSHPNLPASDRAQLNQDRHPFVRIAHLQTAPLTPTIHHELRYDPSPSLRAFLAKQPRLPHDVLTGLVHDRDALVRKTVAEHPAITEAHLRLLADDPDVHVRLVLTTRRDCPSSVLDRLADDRNYRVIHAIASHPNTPNQAIVRLARRYPRRLAAQLVAHPAVPDVERIQMSLWLSTQ